MELCHVLPGQGQLWADAGDGGNVGRCSPGTLILFFCYLALHIRKL